MFTIIFSGIYKLFDGFLKFMFVHFLSAGFTPLDDESDLDKNQLSKDEKEELKRLKEEEKRILNDDYPDYSEAENLSLKGWVILILILLAIILFFASTGGDELNRQPNLY